MVVEKILFILSVSSGGCARKNRVQRCILCWKGLCKIAKNRIFYWISCSRWLNSSVLKNSASVIPNPSHIILMVSSFGFWLFPYKIFFTDEGDNADRLASMLMERLRSSQSWRIRFLTAAMVLIFDISDSFVYMFMIYKNDGDYRLCVLLYSLRIAYNRSTFKNCFANAVIFTVPVITADKIHWPYFCCRTREPNPTQSKKFFVFRIDIAIIYTALYLRAVLSRTRFIIRNRYYIALFLKYKNFN